MSTVRFTCFSPVPQNAIDTELCLRITGGNTTRLVQTWMLNSFVHNEYFYL